MERRRVIAIATAAVLAAFGTLIIVAFVGSAERRALEGEETVTVIIATDPIEVGATREEVEASIREDQFAAGLRPQNALRSTDEIGDDQVVTTRILPGLPLVAGHFGAAGDVDGGSRAAEIDPELEVLSIALERQRAIDGDVRAGDEVGVIVSLTRQPVDADGEEIGPEISESCMVLDKVRVDEVTGGAAIEGDQTTSSSGGGQAITLSLQVDDEDAELIVFGMEFGSVWLTRQGDNVTDGFQTDCVDVNNIFEDLGRQSQADRAAPDEPGGEA